MNRISDFLNYGDEPRAERTALLAGFGIKGG
jgi:hypothetical protein